MKVVITSGELDTDKLPDVKAMFIEKIEDLKAFCHANNTPIFLGAMFPGKQGAYQVLHLVHDTESPDRCLYHLISSMDKYLYNVTKGYARVVLMVPKPPESWESGSREPPAEPKP